MKKYLIWAYEFIIQNKMQAVIFVPLGIFIGMAL